MALILGAQTRKSLLPHPSRPPRPAPPPPPRSSSSSGAVKQQRWLVERPQLFLPRLARHPGSPSGFHQSQAAKKLRRRKTADAKERRRWLNSDSSPSHTHTRARTLLCRHGASAVAGGTRRRTAARGGAVRLLFGPRPRLRPESGQRVHVPAASRDFRVLLPGGAQERLDGGRISGNRVWGEEFRRVTRSASIAAFLWSCVGWNGCIEKPWKVILLTVTRCCCCS